MEASIKKHHSFDYRPDIDGMRAISIFLVTIFHFNLRYFPTGRIGVDVFFVISGYLITTILHKQLAKGTYSLKQFYVRRVKRIFPVLFISLAVFFMVMFFFFKDGFKYMAEHVMGSLLMGLNFWRIKNQYFPQNQFWKYNFVIPNWTLAIQQQFYLLWPLALTYLHKQEARKKYIIMGVFTVLSYLSMIMLAIFVPQQRLAAFIPFCRSWELSAGCFLAVYQFEKAKENNGEQVKLTQNTISQQIQSQTNQKASQKIQQKQQCEQVQKWSKDGSITSAMAALCIIVYATIPSYSRNPGFEMPVITGCALWIITNKKSLFNRNILGSKLFCFVGKISYSFYIWHQGVIMLFDLNKYVSVGVALIAIFVYQIEAKIRFSKHPLTVPLILGFGFILLITACIARFA